MENYSTKLRIQLHFWGEGTSEHTAVIYLVFIGHLLCTRYYAREDTLACPALNGAWLVICLSNTESHIERYNYHSDKCHEEGVRVCVSRKQEMLRTREVPEFYLSQVILFNSHPGKGFPVKSSDIKAI